MTTAADCPSTHPTDENSTLPLATEAASPAGGMRNTSAVSAPVAISTQTVPSGPRAATVGVAGSDTSSTSAPSAVVTATPRSMGTTSLVPEGAAGQIEGA